MGLSDRTTMQALKTKILVFVFALLSLTLILIFSSYRKNTNDSSAFIIMTIGDDDMEMQHPQTQKRWPDYLQDEIDRTKIRPNDVVVLNRSFSFLNTYGFLKRMDALLKHDKPQHVVIQLGRMNKDNLYGSEYYLLPFWFDWLSSSRFEISLDDRDPYERNNPLYLKYNEAFDFCFNPESKKIPSNVELAKAYVSFLEERTQRDEKIDRCLGNLYKNFLGEDSLAFDAFLRAWKKIKNPDLHYVDLYQFTEICGSPKASLSLKMKCLWSAPKYPSLFLSSKKVQEFINVDKKLCSWLERDLNKMVRKLKKKKIGVTLVTYPRALEGESCNPNNVIQQVAEANSVFWVNLKDVPTNQEALTNEQVAHEVFKVLEKTKVYNDVD